MEQGLEPRELRRVGEDDLGDPAPGRSCRSAPRARRAPRGPRRSAGGRPRRPRASARRGARTRASASLFPAPMPPVTATASGVSCCLGGSARSVAGSSAGSGSPARRRRRLGVDLASGRPPRRLGRLGARLPRLRPALGLDRLRAAGSSAATASTSARPAPRRRPPRRGRSRRSGSRPRAAAAPSPSSIRFSESERRRRSASTSMIFTLTRSPCETTSRGFSTWCCASSEMCTSPSTPGRISTKAPNVTTFVTGPGRRRPRRSCRAPAATGRSASA